MKQFKLLLSLILLSVGFSFSVQAQYNPGGTGVTAVNKPFGANGFNLEGRYRYYNSTKFVYRPYQSVAEVLSYLPTAANRTGAVVLINTGGTLNATTGQIDGGTNEEWWFKDGTSNANLVRKTGPILLTDTSRVGDVYNKSAFVNLFDFSYTGSFSTAGGKIVSPAGNNGQLRLQYYTGDHDYVLSFDYRATNGVKSSTGLGLGFLSANPAANISQYVYFNETSRNTVAYSSFGSSEITSPTSLSAYDAGDKMRVSIRFPNNGTFYITVYNLTKGLSNLYTVKLNYGDGSGQSSTFTHNTAMPFIQGLGGSAAYEITNITYRLNTKNGGVLYIGDSITDGSTPGTYAAGYARLLFGQTNAGPGDRSTEVILRLPEILKIQPKLAFVTIGTNDKNSLTFDAWKNNLNTIYQTLTNAGIKVVINTPPPNNTGDLTPYADYVKATYPSVDIFTPLKATSGTGLNPAYNSGDNVHPNAPGHALIGQTILASPLYSSQSYYSSLDSAFLKPQQGLVYNSAQRQLLVSSVSNGSRVSEITQQNAATGETWAQRYLPNGALGFYFGSATSELLNAFLNPNGGAGLAGGLIDVRPDGRITAPSLVSPAMYPDKVNDSHFMTASNTSATDFNQGTFAVNLYWNGTSWSNANPRGLNGWGGMFVAGNSGDIMFAGDMNNSASNRTYTDAQLLAKRAMTIRGQDQVVNFRYSPTAPTPSQSTSDTTVVTAGYIKTLLGIDINGNTVGPRLIKTALNHNIELSDNNTDWYWIHTDNTGARVSTPATVTVLGGGPVVKGSNVTVTQTAGGAVL